MSAIIEEIGLLHYLMFTTLLLAIGLIGVIINRRSIILSLLSLEIILLSVNINFIVFSTYYNNITGQIFSMIILSIAAAESAIGLALIIVHFRNYSSIEVKDLKQLKG